MLKTAGTHLILSGMFFNLAPHIGTLHKHFQSSLPFSFSYFYPLGSWESGSRNLNVNTDRLTTRHDDDDTTVECSLA